MANDVSALFRYGFFLLASLFVILRSTSGNEDAADNVDSLSTNPASGLKIRFSQGGLNYAASMAVNSLSIRIPQLRIPDRSGSSSTPVGKVQYNINNMRVTQFFKPSSYVGVSPVTGLTWAMSNAGVSIRGDWHVKYRIIVPIRDSGWFEGHVSGASISVSAIIGASSSGQPTIRATGCQCGISGVRIKLHGGAGWLYNLFMNSVEKGLRNSLQTMLCNVATQSINVNASRELASLKTKVPIGSYLTLDYSLVSAPTYSTAYIDSFHKGEFFYAGDPSEAPFQPHQLPATAVPSRMVAFWMSDYVVNTAGYVMHKHGKFNHKITRKDLPIADQNLLDISCCSKCKCIGKLLPSGVSERFPNASAELELATASAPTANVNVSGVLVNITGMTKIQARLVNGSLVYLLTLRVQTTSGAIPSFDGLALHAKIQSMSAKIAVVDSAVGPVEVERLRIIVNLILKTKVIPMLNAAGARGIPLPRIDHIRFVNGGLQLQQNGICVYTDLQYIGENSEVLSETERHPEQKKNDPSELALKFEPF